MLVLFVGSTIRTVCEQAPLAHAVLVHNGIIVCVGDELECREFASRFHHSECLEVETLPPGSCLMPAFRDSHLHPVSGWRQRNQCDLRGCANQEEALHRIASVCATLDSGQWLVGGGYNPSWFPDHTPTAALLDSVCGPDRAVYLRDVDGHEAWVSTRALEIARLLDTDEHFTCRNGVIVRDKNTGRPVGQLIEGACALVSDHIPAMSVDAMQDIVEGALQNVLKHGIASIHDAFVRPNMLDAYLEAERRGNLPIPVFAALAWSDKKSIAENLSALQNCRARAAQSANVHANTVKLFVDGLTENGTALLHEPYFSVHESCSSSPSGMANCHQSQLNKMVQALDENNFQVHCHCLGDAAVTMALNAFEKLSKSDDYLSRHQGPHIIAHIQLIHKEDVPRFRRLGVAANMSPYWMHYEEALRASKRLGPPRCLQQYPCRDLVESGALVGFGSDWPVSV